MKPLFATLLCHRDCEIFKFNWFAMRYHLEKGFDLPHLILNDGSLTEEDIASLKELPNIFIENISPYDLPIDRNIVLSKLDGFKLGFEKYGAERVIVFDSDIFFYNNWEADLRKICMSDVTCLRDWGSSLGPNGDKYKELFGVYEDSVTPNSNTGIASFTKKDLPALLEKLQIHIENPFNILHDQGVFFAAFYGKIEYIKGIKCLITGGENVPKIIDWILGHSACHLMGMRTRLPALKFFLEKSKGSLGDINLSQFTPVDKFISWGVLEHETYCYKDRFNYYPSKYQDEFVTDAMYMHAGSSVLYDLPPFFKSFKTQPVILDTGIKNDIEIWINGNLYKPGDMIELPIEKQLKIQTSGAPGGHLAFLSPTLVLKEIELPWLLE